MTLAFARFDLMSWLPRTQSLLPLAFIVVVGSILPVPGMAIAASAFVASLMVSAPFVGDEKGHLDILYGVLPVSRRTVVVGRSLAVIAYAVLAMVIATAVTFAAALVRGSSIAPEILLIAFAAAFAVVGLSLSIQLPVFFRVGYSRGRLAAYAPTLVIAGSLWLSQATGIAAPLSDGSIEFSVPMVVGLGCAIGVLGIVIAILLSVRVYRTRDLSAESA